MSKVFIVVFLIFGTVVGSGFSSGKEIMVFFGRFGILSYLYIFLASILFFLAFFFFLSCGKKIAKNLKKFPFLNIIILFISLVFCASMFAGIKNLFAYFPTWLYAILITILLLSAFFVSFKGIRGLEKINFFLMPLTSILFVFVLVYCLFQSGHTQICTSSFAGILYGPLYVALNTCLSGIVIARAGEGLSKKQIFFASLFSAFLILFFLVLGNFVLQNNFDAFYSEMPFLSIANKNLFIFVLEYFVILAGCFTTLLSLCFTLKSSFCCFIKDDTVSTMSAVFLPFLLSSLGFSHIVSFLYPICSVMGVFMFVFFFLGQRKET